MPPNKPTSARTFFLNDTHELSREERPGGGGAPKLAPIDWARKSPELIRTLDAVAQTLESSDDPLSGHRYFFLTNPEEKIKKTTTNLKKAPSGEYEEPVRFAGEHSRTLHRIGLDLVAVTDEGSAVVHATKESFGRLKRIASSLPQAGVLEQSRWATIHDFGPIPSSLRVDEHWTKTLERKSITDTVIELQPLLNRSEADSVVRKVLSLFRAPSLEKLRATGIDFSGRNWFRCALTAETIKKIAATLFSIQSLHPPLTAPIALAARRKITSGGNGHTSQAAAASIPRILPTTLPTVGLVDGGVPDSHLYLSAFRRGTYTHPDSFGRVVGDHGSLVASRIVFGDLNLHEGLPDDFAPIPRCKFLDVQAPFGGGEIHEKVVVPSIDNCIGAYPDVRVYNLSFSDRRPLDQYTGVEHRERMYLMQDLDNLIFARDIVVIVAAGNSRPGQTPIVTYPEHYRDPDWRLGNWAQTFNSLTCGSFVGFPGFGGIVQHPGAPSAFCKIGPGLADSPVPDLSEDGGDVGLGYTRTPGLGVFACNAGGLWEDQSGTSFAAPILAQRCALLFQSLQNFCPPGSRPFGVTVKAFLALTAIRVSLPSVYEELSKRTLGLGRADETLLDNPVASSVIFLWQGVLETQKEVIRIQLPIPFDWIDQAELPILELFVAWDTPVNSNSNEIYGCRNVTVRLRPSPDERAVSPRRTTGNSRYPLGRRIYDLKRAHNKKPLSGDIWLLEVFYEQIADYYVGLDFTPQQRVALACRLIDLGNEPLSPQSAVQAMPISGNMVRLSTSPQSVRTPVIVRGR